MRPTAWLWTIWGEARPDLDGNADRRYHDEDSNDGVTRMRVYMTGLRVLVIALALLLSTALGARAGSIRVMGSVVEPNSQGQGSGGVTPAEGVTVTIQGTSMHDVTDARGAFMFDHVPEGEVTLVAMKPGYATTVKKITVKGPLPQSVLVYLMPGGGMTNGNPEVIRPDTVYVAFASAITTAAQGNPTNNPPLSGPPSTNMAVIGAIAGGADPFALGGAVPHMPVGPNSYATNISAAPNALMVFDPDQPQKVDYVESQARLYWLAFNPAGTKLFGATDQNVINIYDTVNHNVLLQQIPTGGVVNDMTRVGNFIYAAIMRATGDGIMVIDPSRNGPLRLIPTPGISSGGRAHPWSVTANNDGTRIYVAIGNERDGEVVALDAFTTHPTAVAKVGANPMGIAITPDNRFILVANGKTASVSVLDAFTLQPLAQVPVGVSPFHIAVRPDGTKAYVTCRSSNSVYVINLQTMATGAIIPVGNNPLGIAVTSSGSHVYVANQGSATVSIIDGNSDTFMKTTSPQPRSRPYGVAVKP
jgi:YVTN family beta-propeller protein